MEEEVLPRVDGKEYRDEGGGDAKYVGVAMNVYSR